MHFVPFGCICDHLVALRNSGQNVSNWCKSSCHEDTSEFFATNAPNPRHWTINTCFGVFRTICVRLGPLGYHTKLGEKCSELVQKIVRQSRVRVFHDEHTRSTPLDPKHMFCCVSYHLGAFGTVWLPFKTRCRTGRTSAKVCATKSHWNFSQRKHPIHFIGPTHVLMSFIPFGCIWDGLVALRNSVQNGPN